MRPAPLFAVGALLILAQGLVWIALPLHFEGSIRLDVAEGVVDGPHWQLSYLRHPPFSSWLTGIVSGWGAYRYLGVYAVGFVLATGAFAVLALFLAREDGPAAGLVALMAGLASPYATYVPPQVNHNIGVMPFWALTMWTAWRAFERGRPADWLLFGASVGLGLWAKYALLQLVVPLAILFWLTPAWRRQACTPWPWAAALVCAALIAPHLIDVALKGGTTLAFATRTMPAGARGRLLWITEFTLDCAAAQASMALLAFAVGGKGALRSALASIMRWRDAEPFARFVAVAAFGPPSVVLLAALVGVHPHYLWLTPFALGFAAFWGHAASLGGAGEVPPRAYRAYAAFALTLALAYVGVREIAPHLAKKANYVEMDGPALAALAQRYWAERHTGPIPLIVSLGWQHGFQAAGSIAFDLPYRADVLEGGDPANAPWLDAARARAAGALVVATAPIGEGAAPLGGSVVNAETFERPMVRGAKPETIMFGELLPSGE